MVNRDKIEETKGLFEGIFDTSESRSVKLDDVVAYLWVTDSGTYTIDPKEMVILTNKREENRNVS